LRSNLGYKFTHGDDVMRCASSLKIRLNNLLLNIKVKNVTIK